MHCEQIAHFSNSSLFGYLLYTPLKHLYSIQTFVSILDEKIL